MAFLIMSFLTSLGKQPEPDSLVYKAIGGLPLLYYVPHQINTKGKGSLFQICISSISTLTVSPRLVLPFHMKCVPGFSKVLCLVEQY